MPTLKTFSMEKVNYDNQILNIKKRLSNKSERKLPHVEEEEETNTIIEKLKH